MELLFTYHLVNIKQVSITTVEAEKSGFTYHLVNIKRKMRNKSKQKGLVFTYHLVNIKPETLGFSNRFYVESIYIPLS